ncbi:MAG: right-handed parallel beta-helix repeat-containing protein [Acidimicrobiales bacterium]
MAIAALVGFGPLRAHAPAHAQAAPVDDGCAYEGGTTDDAGGRLYEGTSSARNLIKIRPFRLVKYPCSRPAEFRAVHVKVGRLELVAGGRLVGRLLVSPGQSTYRFEDVASLLAGSGLAGSGPVGSPWVTQTSPGVFAVGAAIVSAQGITIEAAAPAVREIRLLDLPGVFMGGQGATARFSGLRVSGWAADGSGPDTNVADGRPFILYSDGSRLEVGGSEFLYLGADRTSGYGVNWGADTSGFAKESLFAFNFFGVFTDRARDVSFIDNVFRDNLFYGFDPHTSTRNLLVEGNKAFGNGSHGFIVSADVTDSVMRNNHSYKNGGSGIVLDRASDRNRVEANLVEANGGDGITIHGSATNVVSDNVVRNHDVGIRINQPGAGGNVVTRNTVERAETGIWAYGGAHDLTLVDNKVTSTRLTGMILEAPRTSVTGGTISGGRRGFDVRTFVRLVAVKVTDVADGVLVRATGIAELDKMEISATNRGLVVEEDGWVETVDSTVDASRAQVGGGARSPLPLLGIAALLVAGLLQVVAKVRLGLYRRSVHRRGRARRALPPNPPLVAATHAPAVRVGVG